ncbi:uncharacterized protein LOC117168161 [Belonocnema kinseyi]|uniref:uncharacterized protein LOC117168161 n=1 Tax=Belonocnema kinseyi TaxID=2817044 RepID=UPI00143CD8C4|nr:uncharacterized protein LOC117168161 [Belonocnema kinseyi]
MRITSSLLFLVYAIFLHSIEFILCIRLRTLDELFPANNGILPDIKVCSMEYIQSLQNFRKLESYDMENRHATFLKRGDVVVGCEENGNIFPLILLFEYDPRLQHVVFDARNHEYVITHGADFLQMGPNRVYAFVHQRDLAAAPLKPTTDDPRYLAAHREACRAANRATDEREGLLTRNLLSNEPVPQYMLAQITRKYTRTYIQVRDAHLGTVPNNPNRHH